MDTSMREKLLTFADVMIRVPPLFIIDELLRIGLGLSNDNVVLYSTERGFKISRVSDSIVNSIIPTSLLQPFDFEYFAYKMHFIMALKFLCCCLGYIAAICIFMLWTKHLIIVYVYLISVGTIFISYWSNISTMKAIITYVSTQREYTTSILDDILTLDLKYILDEGPGFLIIQNYVLQCLLASIFCYIHLAPRHPILQKLLVLSFMAPPILGICPLPTQVLYHVPVFAALLPLAVCKFVIWYNGITMLNTIYMGYQHARNFISNYGLSALAETEWIRLNVPCVLRMFWMLRVGGQVFQILGNHYGEETFTYYVMIRSLLVNGCETLTAVLGMTSIISFICDYIGCFFQWVLLTEDEDEKSIGTVSAILFYVLALQTGLTSLDREKRLVRLCRNFCLLFTAVLHFVHNIVNPLLMSLSASHNPALHRHIRALAVCVFLILFPVSLLVYLWSHYTVNTCVFWEQLDDCVYIIRSFVFESGGAIRAIMICIHAYFNIWCEAKAGWSVFMKRRSAVNKINSLPEAKAEQLRMLDDDRCPLCHDVLYKVENSQNKSNEIIPTEQRVVADAEDNVPGVNEDR
ncbi:hypothetical protein APICC_03153 [Apis cerana cerana]|uniref:TRC8-like N-terminal domain-containing protein n=1 Tax=Apis cerana cerana TaxID=94128 RepID=A0A2A3ET10_APICC|nr:hypothetical protein APICC_03153 [Apis cerana cerana]